MVIRSIKIYSVIAVQLLCLLLFSACTADEAITSQEKPPSVTLQNEPHKIQQQEQVPSLQTEDFTIQYQSVAIQRTTNVQELIQKLGYGEDYEANNQGFISGDDENRRWNLVYPNYNNPDLRLIVMSEMSLQAEELAYGESYLVATSLESSNLATRRGIKIGDHLNAILQAYGEPTVQQDNTNQDITVLKYSLDELVLEFSVDKATKKIANIFIEWNMQRSIEQQDS